MARKNLFLKSSKDSETIEAFADRVVESLKKKEWVNEDGSIDADKLSAFT